jgi:hypothetical protein
LLAFGIANKNKNNRNKTKQTLIPVLRILLEQSALTDIISHLCDYSLGIYDCAQIIHKPDNPPMDK